MSEYCAYDFNIKSNNPKDPNDLNDLTRENTFLFFFLCVIFFTVHALFELWIMKLQYLVSKTIHDAKEEKQMKYGACPLKKHGACPLKK